MRRLPISKCHILWYFYTMSSELVIYIFIYIYSLRLDVCKEEFWEFSRVLPYGVMIIRFRKVENLWYALLQLLCFRFLKKNIPSIFILFHFFIIFFFSRKGERRKALDIYIFFLSFYSYQIFKNILPTRFIVYARSYIIYFC